MSETLKKDWNRGFAFGTALVLGFTLVPKVVERFQDDERTYTKAYDISRLSIVTGALIRTEHDPDSTPVGKLVIRGIFPDDHLDFCNKRLHPLLGHNEALTVEINSSTLLSPPDAYVLAKKGNSWPSKSPQYGLTPKQINTILPCAKPEFLDPEKINSLPPQTTFWISGDDIASVQPTKK